MQVKAILARYVYVQYSTSIKHAIVAIARWKSRQANNVYQTAGYLKILNCNWWPCNGKYEAENSSGTAQNTEDLLTV
jgi:hypothetical protein